VLYSYYHILYYTLHSIVVVVYEMGLTVLVISIIFSLLRLCQLLLYTQECIMVIKV